MTIHKLSIYHLPTSHKTEVALCLVDHDKMGRARQLNSCRLVVPAGVPLDGETLWTKATGLKVLRDQQVVILGLQKGTI